MRLPDLSGYDLHRIIDDIDLAGVVVPGLRGSFFRRVRGVRVETVGLYEYAGSALFMSWGYAGEEHCRYTSLRRPDGSWGPAQVGCPPVRVLREGGRITGLELGARVLPAERGGRRLGGGATGSPRGSRQSGSGACAATGEVADRRT